MNLMEILSRICKTIKIIKREIDARLVPYELEQMADEIWNKVNEKLINLKRKNMGRRGGIKQTIIDAANSDKRPTK